MNRYVSRLRGDDVIDTFRDVFVRTRGLRHHLVERGRPGSKAVIMIPAQTSQGHALDTVAVRLARNYHVYCQDPRGRGESDWAAPDDYTIDQYVADLEAIREALQLERVAVVGSHLGGVVAMYYASRFPERVSGVVLNDIAPELVAASARRYLARLANPPSSFPDLESVARFYRDVYPDSLGKLPPESLLAHSQWQVRWSDEAGAYIWKMDPMSRRRTPWPSAPAPWEMFRSIRAPILLVRGDQSELVSADTAQRMMREGTDCRVVAIPGVRQTVTLSEPESIAAIDLLLSA